MVVKSLMSVNSTVTSRLTAPAGLVLARRDDLADEFARHVDGEGLYRVARRRQRAGERC